MILQNLTQLEFIYGSFTLIFVLIAILIGIKLISKYFTYKLKEFITVGLTWVFLSSAWWGGSISFVLFILFNTSLPEMIYLFLNNGLIPIAFICWIFSFAHFIYPRLKKQIVGISAIICLIYEIFLIIFLFTNPDIIGTFEGKFNLQAGLYSMIFQLFSIFVFLITGILFAKNSMKSVDLVVKWKGKFLLIGFIFFTVGALIEATIIMTPISLVIMRIILIVSGVFYYLGFYLPEKLSDFLIKEG
ncbi:MAG: hypothetical protein GF383_10600 [Candidatus Lokiarchaeota archaeon]|nr:hypothetical protein [Candidatus Lokiarchaeota archaeon]MBD3341022.1 hypothetical protein [Candidatus Lokiarchaeota archaeon]